ncbi:hypothetical protein SAMN06272765_7333 [Streptomyces sp. Ag109_G2-15]|nr:hypothetical protein SAMN06272765_7333 [Streptomyces sp. Ag109_G2-15]
MTAVDGRSLQSGALLARFTAGLAGDDPTGPEAEGRFHPRLYPHRTLRMIRRQERLVLC